ncbi:phosphatase PAP2 family protein [Kitasatospora sp. NBC_00085]|uniref:phosphatase PAP2 family protein n=1 Tax=unclassified Kitasatospora TaxID=2633591 RepID=UPI00324DAD32
MAGPEAASPRRRAGGGAVRARALAAPLVVAVAFAADTVLKALLHEPRPCQVLDAGTTPEACPGAGDWSLPSNHTVIVFAGPRPGRTGRQALSTPVPSRPKRITPMAIR